MKEKARVFCLRFLRRHLILIIAIAVLVIEGLIVHAIAYRNGRSVAREEYAALYEERIQAYIAEQEAAKIKPDEVLLQEKIDADTYILERVGMGVLLTYDRADLNDAGTQMQTCVNRVLSGGEFQRIGSIQEAVAVSGAWTGFDMRASVTEDVHELALKIATAYHKGEPMPCSSKYLWTEWDYTENALVARDKYMIDSSCHYWRYSVK